MTLLFAMLYSVFCLVMNINLMGLVLGLAGAIFLQFNFFVAWRMLHQGVHPFASRMKDLTFQQHAHMDEGVFDPIRVQLSCSLKSCSHALSEGRLTLPGVKQC